MTLSLRLAALGAAKILARRHGGFLLLIIGGAIGAVVRPNELLLIRPFPPIALRIRPSPNAGGSKAGGRATFPWCCWECLSILLCTFSVVPRVVLVAQIHQRPTRGVSVLATGAAT